MAELDLALLAEYAKVDQVGLLTIVGGGFDRLQVSTVGQGTMQQLYTVLRFRLSESEPPAPFEVKIRPADASYEIGLTGSATKNPGARPVDGYVHFAIAVGMFVPLPVAGRYVVEVQLDGESVRELPFVVEISQR
jgi:hypothetical protein